MPKAPQQDAAEPPAATAAEAATPKHTPPAKHTLYAARFVVAGCFVLGNAANSLLWSSFSSVTPSARTFYNTNSFAINALSLVFLVLYLPVSPLSSWVLDTKGLRASALIGCLLTVAGAGVRWAGAYAGSPVTRYAAAMVGQALASIAQPFVLNAPSRVTADWFGERERTLANTAISLGSPVGSAAVLLLGPAIIGDDPNNFKTLHMICFFVCLVCALPCFFVRDRPPTPPSFSSQIESEPFMVGVKGLAKSKQYIILWIVFGVFIAIFNTYLTLISDYVSPYGYTQDQSGNLGVITIAVGIVAAGLIGAILDRTKAHEITLKIACLFCVVGVVLFLIGMAPNQYIFLCIGAALLGIGGFPTLPIVLEVAVEVTFPIAPGTSAGFLMWSGQGWGILLLLISNALRGSDGNLYYAMVFTIAFACFGAVVSFFFRNTMKRTLADRQESFTPPHGSEMDIQLEPTAAA
ncbi:hypothetical protein HK105_200956 [Polyrhizophydium stewartii]|uniref:Major facilitator superfamily (MFS) profile domain-containing protein n=1 Tax=Polyrhizophydium stewartii TaxID=2732419 RepID=A0ABR4NIG0_9FUNG